MTRRPLLLVTVVVAALVGGCGDEREGRRAAASTDPQAGWTAYREADRGFAVRFPSDWRRAPRSLTPYLADPREILSLGTGPLVARTSRSHSQCAQKPVAALAALGPRDVLVSVQERRRPDSASYPPRRSSFRLGTRAAGPIGCLSAPSQRRTWWIPFRDGDRAFYALVAIGLDAPLEQRRTAERVLDSLRFDPGGRDG